jgi:hypothetical protein
MEGLRLEALDPEILDHGVREQLRAELRDE